MSITNLPRHSRTVDTDPLANALSEEVRQTERTLSGHTTGREGMREWLTLRAENVYSKNQDFRHTVRFHLPDAFDRIDNELTAFGHLVPTALDEAVTENDLRFNNPRIDPFNGIGDRIDQVVHHPAYTLAGDMIYGTGVVKKLTTAGGLREGMSFYFLTNHVGEAGHNCPVICNYETARVLKRTEDFPGRDEYIRNLEEPSYTHNFTSSQFLTEVQGGSDVGANDTRAWQDKDGSWYIRGEKWFCSNANAELMVISARRSTDHSGTKGLSMFLIPSTKPDGTRNHFTMRRLKEKMGTRALASAEIDYHDAYAIPLGDNFKFMLENVIHHSRISLAVSVLGFTTRAWQLAYDFARTRKAFGECILNYPLVQENLAKIKADTTVSLAGTFALIALQDKVDTDSHCREDIIAFSRLMSNIGKSVISKRAVDNVHHCVDGIGGNGAIETTSSMPRLMRDVIILENWEGTHNTLYMQVLRDIHRSEHDKAYLSVISEQINALTSEQSQEKQQASNALDRLRFSLTDFHSSSEALQTLKIVDIVTQMANLFYFVSAVREGAHQLKEMASTRKLDCAALFHRMFISTEAHVNDDQYLTLCKNITDLS